MKNQQSINPLVLSSEIKQKLVTVRGQLSLLDRDVAALYGVETRVINQAVKNNPEKFPAGYVLELSSEELSHLRSKFLTANVSSKSRALPKVFTERGLYMLATILKGEQAVRTTLAIIETYAQVRAMVRDMEALQTLKDGSVEQASKLSQAGHKLASLIGDNLSTDSTKTTIELNLAVLKITHEVRRAKRQILSERRASDIVHSGNFPDPQFANCGLKKGTEQ